MLTSKTLATAFVSLGLLAGCAANDQGQKQTIGTVLGAVGGGLLGSQVGSGKGKLIGVGVGALAGAWLGSEVGKSMDDTDRLKASRTTQSALEYTPAGTTSSWTNPDTGYRGTTTPTKTYQSTSGQNCREYTTTITVDGRTEQAYGTACREADGTWRVVN